MRRITTRASVLVATCLVLASAAFATPLPNSAVLHLRVFNDCPISILTTSNVFPGSIVIDDQNQPPQPLCAGFANLHTWRFSTDGVNAIRADLLRRLGRSDEAAWAYDTALSLVGNAAERRFLEERRRSL